MKKKLMLLVIALLAIVGLMIMVLSKKEEVITTEDAKLSQKATLLEIQLNKFTTDSISWSTNDSIKKIVNDYDLDSVNIYVMQKGYMPICYSHTYLPDSNYYSIDATDRPTFSVVMRGAVYLLALEHGAKNDYVVDTGNGIYLHTNLMHPESIDTIHDHNWRLGGYGKVDLLHGFMWKSDIAFVRSIEAFLPNSYATLDSCLNNMGLQHQERIEDYQGMQKAQMTPKQMLYWIYAVMNDSLECCSKRNTELLRQAMALYTVEGLGKRAMSPDVKISGMNDVSPFDDFGRCTLSYIGSFSTDKDSYYFLVECYKKNPPFPVSLPTFIAKHFAESSIYFDK